jgi:adenine deaminase
MKKSLGRQAVDRRRLIDVALGREPADRVIVGGTLVNTFTAELLPGWGVAVAGDRIAAVGDVSHCIGQGTEVVDASGLYVAPGFFDPHYHIESSRLVPARHAEVTVPYGLTTLLEDPHEACAVIGKDGLRFFIEQAAGIPQRILLSVSSATPPTDFETVGGYIGPEEFREALDWENVQGLGEVMDPPRLFGHDPRLWGMISHAEALGRRVEGHGGFLPPEADAFAAAGMGSSHSPRSAAEAIAMLRRGLYLQLQVDRAREILPALLEAGVDLSNVGLAVDDRAADQLLAVGPINFEVQRLIALGVPAPRAYQMASFNNARYWRLDGEIGVIAPGRYADMLLVSDLDAVKVERVYLGGRLVAEHGRLTVESEATVPDYARGTVRLARPLAAADFRLPARDGGAAPEARVMVLKPGYYGREMDVLTDTLPVIGGAIAPSPAKGIAKAAVIDRHQATGNVGLGFWRLGLQEGAIAFTVLHDSHNLCVVGMNEADMAVAANHVASLGGGIAIVRNGEVLADLPLPVLGLMSEDSLEEIARRQAALDEIGKALGLDTSLLGPHPADRLTFIFLTCHPRKYQLTDQGLFDVLTGQRIPVQVD